MREGSRETRRKGERRVRRWEERSPSQLPYNIRALYPPHCALVKRVGGE